MSGISTELCQYMFLKVLCVVGVIMGLLVPTPHHWKWEAAVYECGKIRLQLAKFAFILQHSCRLSIIIKPV